MRSNWRTSRPGEAGVPVEMRFIDMFMTALGSLVFIALLLVVLLPKVGEVFVEGRIIRKDDNAFVILTAGDRKTGPGIERRIVLDTATLYRRHLPQPASNFEVGEHVIVAGRSRPNGSIVASLIEGQVKDPAARLVLFEGRLIEKSSGNLRIETQRDGVKSVAVSPQTRVKQGIVAVLDDLHVGETIEVVGEMDATGAVVAHSVNSLWQRPPPLSATDVVLTGRVVTRSEKELTLRTDAGNLRTIALGKATEVGRLSRGALAELTVGTEVRVIVQIGTDGQALATHVQNRRQLPNLSEDEEIQKRWFSVQLDTIGCRDVKLFFYVRFTGENLVNRNTGTVWINPVTQRSAATEFSMAWLIDDTLSDADLKTQVGFPAYHDTEGYKIFHAVARTESNYQVYVALRTPGDLGDRQCSILPIYLAAQNSPSYGARISLTKERPYAMLRRIQINKDGSNNLAVRVQDDPAFMGELERFSRQQSEALLTKYGSIKCTMDAHLFALGGKSSCEGQDEVFFLQVASFPTRPGAAQARENFQRRYGELLGNSTVEIVPAAVAGTTRFRLEIAPPTAREKAEELCRRLKAEGWRECIPTAH